MIRMYVHRALSQLKGSLMYHVCTIPELESIGLAMECPLPSIEVFRGFD